MNILNKKYLLLLIVIILLFKGFAFSQIVEQPKNDTVCENNNASFYLVDTYTQPSYQWQRQLLFSWTELNNGIYYQGVVTSNLIIQNTPLSFSDSKYRCVIYINSIPIDTSEVVELTVDNESFGGTATVSPSVICLNSNISLALLDGTYLGNIVRWEKNEPGQGWTQIPGSGNPIITFSPDVAGSWQFRAAVKSGICSEDFSSSVQVIVDPVSIGGTATVNLAEACINSSISLNLTGGTYTGNVQRWEKKAPGQDWIQIPGSSNPSISYNLDIAGSWKFRAAVKSGECNEVLSNDVIVSVDPDSDGGMIIGGYDTICLGNSTGTLTLTGFVGSILEWQRRLNNGNWINISNSSAVYTEIPLSCGIWDYRAEVESGNCPSDYSLIHSVFVNENAAAGSLISIGDTSVCEGSMIEMILTNFIGNIITWQYRIPPSTLWNNINNNTPFYSDTIYESIQYRVEVLNQGCMPDYSNIIHYNVFEDPIPPLLTRIPDVLSVCDGIYLTATIEPGSGGTSICYDEYRYSLNSGASWSEWSYNIPYFLAEHGINIIQGRRYCNGSGCNSELNQVIWNVTSQPEWSDVSCTNEPICLGGTVLFDAAVSGGLGGNISWVRSNNPGQPGDTVTSPDIPSDTGTYFYRPSYAAVGEGCNLADGIETPVTVLNKPEWSQINCDSDPICEGGQVNFSSSVNGGYEGEIIWTRSNNPGQSGISVISPDIPPISGDYYYRPTYISQIAGCNLENGNETHVNVVTDPSFSQIYCIPETLCLGEEVSLYTNVVGGLGGNIEWWKSQDLLSWEESQNLDIPETHGIWYYKSNFLPVGNGCDFDQFIYTGTSVIARPQQFVIDGKQDVCRNEFWVEYKAVPVEGGIIYDWTIEGGDIMTGHNTNKVMVHWDDTSSNGIISLAKYNLQNPECWNEEELLVNIGPEIAPDTIAIVAKNNDISSGILICKDGFNYYHWGYEDKEIGNETMVSEGTNWCYYGQVDTSEYLYFVYFSYNDFECITKCYFNSPLYIAMQNNVKDSYNSINIFPNPFNNELNIHFNSDIMGNIQINLYTMYGIKVLGYNDIKYNYEYRNTLKIDKKLNSNLYLIEINIDDIIVKSYKLIYKL